VKTLLLKNLFLSNALLKIICLLLGYSFWYIASFDHIVTIQISIPLCFTAITDNYRINAPETIQVTLKGKRSAMYALDKETLAAHVAIDNLLPGKHGININEQHLFLPKTISLIHYKPSNLSLTIQEIQKL
jgi:YbbR domain-containing protein